MENEGIQLIDRPIERKAKMLTDVDDLGQRERRVISKR